MLIRLIYASTARTGVGMPEFKGILQQAQTNNHRSDLTGVLAFNSKIFLQALEGSRERVNGLYAKLLRDDRHHTVAMLHYEEIEEREWTSWSMGFVAPGADNRAAFLKYSGESVFNPYAMKGTAVKRMLSELAARSIGMTASAESPAFPTSPSPSSFNPLTPAAPRREMPPIRPLPAVAATATAAPSADAAGRTPAARPESDSLFGRFLNR